MGVKWKLRLARSMRASSDMNSAKSEPRWTGPWVFFVSVLTPTSAWMLHSVNPDMVAWYLGIMAWLTMTPERRPRLFATKPAATPSGTSPATATTQPSSLSQKGLALSSQVTQESSESESNPSETGTGKAKKPRTKARKPKTVTLAEMKMLTGGADRAVVWSQVGPGKFVRQPGEDGSESDGDGHSSSGSNSSNSSSGMVIEAVASNSVIVETQTQA